MHSEVTAMAANSVRRIPALLASLLCLSVYSGESFAQAQDTRQMVQVAKDVYTMTGAGSNSSFVVTD